MWLLFSLLTTPATSLVTSPALPRLDTAKVQHYNVQISSSRSEMECIGICITFCRGGEQQLTQKGLKMQLYSVNWQEMIRGLHIGTFLNSLRLGDDRMQKLHLACNVCIKRTSLH